MMCDSHQSLLREPAEEDLDLDLEALLLDLEAKATRF